MLRNVTCKTLPVRRAQGQSAVAGAAYRAGVSLYDERRERTVDYSHRQGDVWHAEILTPADAPDWAKDRAQLWNQAEACERRKDGRPARDVILGFAWELTPEAQRDMARSFAEREFVDNGHAVDIAFHRYGQRISDASEEGRETLRRWAAHDVPFLEADQCAGLHAPHVLIERQADHTVRGYKIYQPHAHLYVTPRTLSADGFSSIRNRQLDRAEQAMAWRYEWPKHQNRWLEAAGHAVRVSATAEEHPDALPFRAESVSQAAYHIEQRGEASHARDSAELNAVHNDAVRQAAADMEAAPQADSHSRFARMRVWWRNLHQHVSAWRERWRNRRGDSSREDEPSPADGRASQSPEASHDDEHTHD